MKKEVTGLDAAMQLSQQIQDKCQIHKALSIAIGAIHSAFEDRNPNELLGEDPDIDYVPKLVDLSVKITQEIDEMSEKLTDMLFNLKPENCN